MNTDLGVIAEILLEFHSSRRAGVPNFIPMANTTGSYLRIRGML